MAFTFDYDSAAQMERIRQELADSFDEELEMEIDESRLEDLLADVLDHPADAGRIAELVRPEGRRQCTARSNEPFRL